MQKWIVHKWVFVGRNESEISKVAHNGRVIIDANNSKQALENNR